MMSEDDDETLQQQTMSTTVMTLNSTPSMDQTTATTEDETSRGESRQDLENRLTQLLGNVERLSTTESIGRRNVVHRRTQSNHLYSILDSPQNQRHRVRSLSVAEVPSLLKFHPGSHLLDDFVAETGVLYLSLWLLPPQPLRSTTLSKEIAHLALTHVKRGSSAPFVPHITIIGSIKCETQRQAQDVGQELLKGLAGTGAVPCVFKNVPCQSMYDDNQKLVWSQACIAIMERSPEYMRLLQKARDVLHLPPGEWMFPAPAKEPHYSKYYGTTPLAVNPAPPPNFEATEAALYLTTPGTVQGVGQWRQVTRINLL